MSENDSKDQPLAEKAEQGVEMAAAVPVERPEVMEPRGWVSDWFEDWPRLFGRRFPESWWRGATAMETIRVEQFRDGDQVVIRAELPGVDPDEAIDVSVAGDRLTISAHREQREESKNDDGFRSEFHYGSFRRVMSLPAGTTTDDVKASYNDGILEVRVPVDTAAAAKSKVPIERKS